MLTTFVNGWYLSTDHIIGSWSVLDTTPSPAQENNANIVRSFFLNEGWTLNAICGMLGCMQGESTINPAFIQATNRYRLPNSAADLSDVPNTVMENFYKEYYQVTQKAFGIGLVQWDGYSNRGGVNRQKLVAYCEDNNIIWYDGWSQLYRLRGEQQYDVYTQPGTFFNPVTISGVQYDFSNYPYSTASPEILAAAFTAGYERNAGGVGFRDDNARYWYDYFSDPLNPIPVIPPSQFSDPLQWDPDEPPFDPSDPTDPDAPGLDYIPAWLVTIFSRRKEILKRWIKG